MTPADPVLFVSHEGTRTGAPMVLLHFLRWMHDNSAIPFEVALLRGGPLAAEFAEVAPTTVLGEQVNWPAPTLAEAGLSKIGWSRAAATLTAQRLRRQVSELRSARSVYLNSAASLRLLHHLPQADAVVAHVHELDSALRWSLRPADPPLLRTRVDHVVAVADCVADNLVENHGVARSDITRIYEFVDVDAVTSPPTVAALDLRARLGLAADSLVVGGSGFGDWRKGIDLFVLLAGAVHAAGVDAHFVWVGDRAGGAEREELDFDVRHLGLDDHVHFVGLSDRPHDWFRAFDVFALTSREDPYPLVGLETALLGVPMVCFAAGGMVELVRRGSEGDVPSGVVVDYLDVDGMARAVIDLLAHPDRRRRMGERAAGVVRRDHDVGVAAPQLLEVVERVLGRPR